MDVLPEVAKEDCFAMHGGSAINLFVRNMPRLSVDIDLTYVEIAERTETLDAINDALIRIRKRIEKLRPTIRIQHRNAACKLLIDDGALIKIEVNTIGRGLLGEVTKTQLCKAAQEQFSVFCVMTIVPMGQLYGSKLCAALDRQHPRDLFDVKLLLENEGFTNDVKRGLMFALASSSRPTHELLDPNLLDQRTVFEHQFEGMSTVDFAYEDFKTIRHQLIKTVKVGMDENDKTFLLSLNRLAPDWSVYDFREYPSVKWKILNMEKFKRNTPDEYQRQLSELEIVLKQ